MPPQGGKAKKKAKLPFNRKLVLHQWLLGLFGVEGFDQLAEHLRDEAMEGLDENNVHKLHHALCIHLPVDQRPELPDEVLLEHDQAIVAVTQRLNERRLTRGEPPIVWKYFQYLALLFTEIYLERYFRDPRALLVALNQRMPRLNDRLDRADRSPARRSRRLAAAQQDRLLDGDRQRQDALMPPTSQYRRFLETTAARAS
jgi:hypothetical protein